MKITDKMIEDIRIMFCDDWSKNEIIDMFLQHGYEVEEEKTALEEARNMNIQCYSYPEIKEMEFRKGSNFCNYEDMDKKIQLYEKAIGEIQQKPKIDDDLIDWIKDSIQIVENDGFGYSDEQNKEYFTKLLKQLGE